MLQIARRSTPLFLAVLCLATVIPGLFLSFEDSEIWGITSSRRLIDHPWMGTSAHYKPLFSLLFGGIATLANSDWSALITSRWLTISFAAGGFFSMYAMGLQLLEPSPETHRRRFVTILSYAIFCTMPLVLVHSTKARSDIVSANIILIAGFALIQMSRRSSLQRGLVYTISGLAALLVTPKSIDLVLALGIIFWLTEKNQTAAKWKFIRALWLAGPLVTILAISLVISREFIIKSAVYWLDTYQGIQLATIYPWLPLRQSFLTAPIAATLLVAGLVFGVLRFRRLSTKERGLVAIGLIVALFITIHSQKFFFFLASRVPFLGLAALPGIHALAEWTERHMSVRSLQRILIGLFIVAGGMTASHLQSYPGFRLGYQKEVYQALEDYLDRSQTTRYWDAIGLFPTRNRIFHYPSPGDRTNAELLNYVDFSHPAMILRTSKMELLEPQFMLWLKPRYLPLASDVYIRYQDLAPTEDCTYNGAQIREKMRALDLKPPFALVTKTATLENWIRVPFVTAGNVEKDTLAESDLESSFQLRNCSGSGVRYAITEGKPWEALPVPIFTPFFGYDGTL